MAQPLSAWLWLFIAGCCEVAWAIGLKKSPGYRLSWINVWTVATMLLSFHFLSLALRHLPVGTAYAIWTGIGAVGVAAIGILWFGEQCSLLRVGSMALIIAGIVGLKAAA